MLEIAMCNQWFRQYIITIGLRIFQYEYGNCIYSHEFFTLGESSF